ncbi:MAG: family 43 glycosylhydrolase [Bacteroidaceae bacterium]|nr:family 43 glycosylhydrolase [Bacteroidaceae bacterium]
MIRKALSALLLLLTVVVANGQGYRSLSVWHEGSAREYSLVTLDSMVFENNQVSITDDSKNADEIEVSSIDSITLSVPDIVSTNKLTAKQLQDAFEEVSVKLTSFKKVGNGNPLMGHKFGADPFGMVDGDRLYVYMTDDHLYRSTDGKPITGAWDYSDCKNVTIISSEDLVNWTDHGTQHVANTSGPASWASQMWAPCAAHKTINGKEQYFLYFSNSNNGIGVLVSDGPYGPWKQPASLNGALITRSTANCSDVLSVYDPAVLIDDDGKAYIYFGGGFKDDNPSDPGTARCVQLGDDMVSIVGTPVKINPPYLFEDAGINKVGGKYLYSYCSNFKAGNEGPGSGNVAYMRADSPLGPFTYVGRCFENPGSAGWAGGGGNHHHAFIEFKGKYYALYHTRTLKSAMRSSNKDINDNVELRSTCISEIKVDTTKSTISNLSASSISEEGVAQVRSFDPYREVPGPTMAWERNVTTKYFKYKSEWICTAEMTADSWMCLSKVDFQDGAEGFTAQVRGKGMIAVTTDFAGKWGTYVAIAEVDSPDEYSEIRVPLIKKVEGVQSKLYITASDKISLKSWSFIR